MKKFLSFNSNDTLSKFAEMFELSGKDASSWKSKEKTLEALLNLSPSEDSTITHFLIQLLKKALGYIAQEIDIKPTLHINYKRKVVETGGKSDVVVKKGKRPVFVIEAKAYGHPLKTKTEDAEGQAWDYTRANELKPTPWYHVTTNVVETCVYETATRKLLINVPESELDERLPQLINLLGKNKISAPTPTKIKEVQTIFRKPIANSKEFERVLFKCQDFMREAEEAKTGKSAFDEMNKLLFIKIFEDRRERKGEENRFTMANVAAEGSNYIKGTLFSDVKEFYQKNGKPIFSKEDEINLDSPTVNRIVEKLQDIYLVDEDGKVYDAVGDVYENFVSTVFRGENGQFFTPRPIVRFITKMVGINWGQTGVKVCDPACGSGGFLLETFAKLHDDLKKEFCKKAKNGELVFKSEVAKKEYEKCKKILCNELLIGFDNEDSVAKTAMMNLSVHGDGSVGVYSGNSLVKKKTEDILQKEGFGAVMTNPPFSVSIKKDTIFDADEIDILEKYQLAHSHRYRKDSNEFEELKGTKNLLNQDSKILFLERCHELVKESGYVGIIVDDGVLNNVTDVYVRDWLFRNFVLRAVIALPFGAFKERGADNYTSVLILQKKAERDIQGNIFMAIAGHIGELFGKVGYRERNDLEDIHKEWEEFKNGKVSGFKYSFVLKKIDIENYFDDESNQYINRLDPKYYHPKIRKIIKTIEKGGNATPINAVVDFQDERCRPEDVNAFGTKYIERITKQGVIEFDIIDGVDDPKSRMDRVFKTGDLVASRINIKSGMIAFVKELDEIRATGEYYKLVPKIEDGKPKILKDYLYIVLTSPSTQALMNALATGQYGRLKEEELGKIKISVPEIEKQGEIIKKFANETKKIKELKRNAEDKRKKLVEVIESAITRGL